MANMTKTIHKDNLKGKISLNKNDGVSIKINLVLDSPLTETDVIKAHVFSSSSINIPLLNCGTASFREGAYIIEKDFGEKSLDTIIVIRKNVFTEDIYILDIVCFNEDVKRDTYDTEEKLLYLKNNPAYKEYLSEAEDIKSPIENGEDALENLKENLSKSNPQGASEYYMDLIRKTAENYKIEDCNMLDGFVWHRIESLNPIAGISSFSHILHTPSGIESFFKYSHYLLGLHKEKSIFAISIPTDNTIGNPISHIDDCTIFCENNNIKYCTVCVELAQDGQYFINM